MYGSSSFTTMLAIASSLVSVATAASTGVGYTLTDDLSYTNFFSAFEFFDGPDPTKGFVQYQDAQSAVDQKLVGLLQDTKSVFMGVDYTTKDPKGRASVRLESTKTWNHGVLIADIGHMPASTCGSWPAFWLLGQQAWPVGGEIDILEGVNDYDSNAVTLHTSQGCVVDNSTAPAPNTATISRASTSFTGFLNTDNCDVAAPNQPKNVGCSIHAPDSLPPTSGSSSSSSSTLPPASYGTRFNAAQGGIYALEWTAQSISVFFFPHGSPLYRLAANTSSPDPSAWGAPLAHFSGAACDFEQRFADMRIIFDTTFCGEWAGKEWVEGGCMAKTGASTCEAYVRQNPRVFRDSWWEIRGLKWFQKGVKSVGVAAGKPKGRWDRR
ncbi:concanavalin A-like lectin/glucanase domain-containing protein [Ampelomyces quisqualis]|uniref:endo-1,3(4)-beta-glucanase n=1 Tax=Ampelomyces quisqualis TaxID=50730 RepID=A0A6A5R198_AMPQU|nr:concanavalin A-like lectin/glucanase domain-containing protein [Ampelomyces quisqualis]